MRIHKIKTLFKLGIEDLMKNMNVLIYVIMPLGFALLYSNMGGATKEALFSICVLLNLAMVPIALMGTIIAEEKEKNTLRTLMLNDVKASEVLLAKAFICMMFVIANNVLIYFILGLSMNDFVLYQLIGLFVSLAIIFFGAFIGLFAKNQMSAGLLSMPFMVVFMAPLFISMIGNEIATTISKFLPTDAVIRIFTSISEGHLVCQPYGHLY